MSDDPKSRAAEDDREKIPPDVIRKKLFERDAAGRTPLFHAAGQGLKAEVEKMLFSLAGVGAYPERLVFIATKDSAGLTAADVAEQNGHSEIADLLRAEAARMEYFG